MHGLRIVAVAADAVVVVAETDSLDERCACCVWLLFAGEGVRVSEREAGQERTHEMPGFAACVARQLVLCLFALSVSRVGALIWLKRIPSAIVAGRLEKRRERHEQHERVESEKRNDENDRRNKHWLARGPGYSTSRKMRSSDQSLT